MSNALRSPATILHADLDSFYASVEQRDDPALRGKPIAVGGGVVLAASYEAKAFGVRTAMSGGAARRVCPNLIEVPARFDAYTEASTRVFDIFRDTSPIVEPMSIDEAFLDVAGLWRIAGSPTEIAVALRRRVADEVGLPISIGVARTKFLAKVASAVSKPDGLLVVEPDGELDFLHPLPVQRLWGVGTVTATKLHERGIHTVAEVAAMSPDALVAIVGRAMGHQLHALAHNRDARRVTSGTRRGSIGSQQALGRRQRSRDEIDVILWRLVDRVAGRMRRAGRVGRTITLRLRFDDLTRATRVAALFPTPRRPPQWFTPLRRRSSTRRGRSSTPAASACSGCRWATSPTTTPSNSSCRSSGATRKASTPSSMPLRERFGRGALQRATTIRGDPGIQLPMLPD